MSRGGSGPADLSLRSSQAAVRWDNLETIAANSFFNFHARDLDYICLRRDPSGETHKVYFLPEARGGIVFPHDHRYDFETTLLAGDVQDRRFERVCGATSHRCHDWFTPLLGGDGFSEDGEPVRLVESDSFTARDRGTHWKTRGDVIHTLRPMRESVIYLVQGRSRPGGSSTYIPEGIKPPSLDGLYTKPTVNTVRERLRVITRLLADRSASEDRTESEAPHETD